MTATTKAGAAGTEAKGPAEAQWPEREASSVVAALPVPGKDGLQRVGKGPGSYGVDAPLPAGVCLGS